MLTGADYTGAVVGTAGSALLIWAGSGRGSKPWRHARRLTGFVEIAAGIAALLLPGRLAGTLLALIFLGFTLVHLRGHRSGRRGL